jgi:Fur family ferric uptake transcriptional regulator
MTRTEQITSILLSKKIKASPARMHLLDVFMSSAFPLDVDAVIKKVGSTIHLATIYRTIDKFVLAGILERVDFQEGKFRYEFMHDHHHHAICNGCGKVEDISDDGLNKIESNIKAQTGFSVTRHTLELFGLCKTCQRSH